MACVAQWWRAERHVEMKVARENMDSGFDSSERNEASRAGQRIRSLRGDEGKQAFP